MAEDHPTQPTLWNTGGPLKRCSKCGENKPISEFRSVPARTRYRNGSVHGTRPSERFCYCRPCWREIKKAYRKRKPETASNRRQRIKNYGLTEADYEAMEKSQDGLCAICRQAETFKHPRAKKVSALAIDHDHKTGKVRGLLCCRCNWILGSAEDDVNLLREAVAYLEKHQ